MSKRFLFTLLFAISFLSPRFAVSAAPRLDLDEFTSTVGTQPVTLQEAFEMALQYSEDLSRREQLVREVEARIDELQSGVLPSVSLMGSEFIQDRVTTTSSSGNQNLTRRSRTEAKVNANLPLFSGFREFLAIKSGRAQKKSAEAALSRARSLFYLEVAQAYATLFDRQQQILVRESILKVSRDRNAELKNRLRIGRSRDSEMLAAESQYAQLEAELQQVIGDERVAQETLQFLTGAQWPLAPLAIAVSTPAPVATLLGEVSSRPDVLGARQDVEASRFELAFERRRRWPYIDVDGNYYLEREGSQADIDWDATFSAELPLYSGGASQARINQADARRRQREELLSLALRRAELEVKSAHRDLTTALAVARSLEKATRLAEANSKAQAADYKLGLVDNLDVLESVATYQQTRLRLTAAQLAAALAAARLDVALGGPR